MRETQQSGHISMSAARETLLDTFVQHIAIGNRTNLGRIGCALNNNAVGRHGAQIRQTFCAQHSLKFQPFLFGIRQRQRGTGATGGGSAHSDHAMEKALRQRTGLQRLYRHGSGRLARDRYIVRVATKAGDVALYPFERRDLVRNA
jgi:hypothetical protein